MTCLVYSSPNPDNVGISSFFVYFSQPRCPLPPAALTNSLAFCGSCLRHALLFGFHFLFSAFGFCCWPPPVWGLGVFYCLNPPDRSSLIHSLLCYRSVLRCGPNFRPPGVCPVFSSAFFPPLVTWSRFFSDTPFLSAAHWTKGGHAGDT